MFYSFRNGVLRFERQVLPLPLYPNHRRFHSELHTPCCCITFPRNSSLKDERCYCTESWRGTSHRLYAGR